MKNAGLLSECTPCTIGHYCTGITAAPLPCDKGYFCPMGQTVKNPGSLEYIMGDPLNRGGFCPGGYYCEAAT
jgi:hypothetical protein